MEGVAQATSHMDRGGAQAAMKTVVTQCGIKKGLPISSAALTTSPYGTASPHTCLSKGLSLSHIQGI